MALPSRQASNTYHPSHGLQELTRSSSSMRVSSATARTESKYAARTPLRTARSDRSVASSSHQPANTHGEPVHGLTRSSSTMGVSSDKASFTDWSRRPALSASRTSVLPKGGKPNTAAKLLRTPSRHGLAFQMDQMLPPRPIAPAPPGLASSTSSLSLFTTRSDFRQIPAIPEIPASDNPITDTDGSVYRHSQTTSRRAPEMAEGSVLTGSANTPPNSLRGSSVPQANSSRAFPCFPSSTAPVSNPQEINSDEAKGKAEDPRTTTETTVEAEMLPRTTETSASNQATELSPTTTATANADASMTEEVDTIPVEESSNQRLDDERGNGSEPPAEHREETKEMHREEKRLEIRGNEEISDVEDQQASGENMEISEDENQQASVSGFNHSYEEGSWDGQGSEERLDDEGEDNSDPRAEHREEKKEMQVDEVANPEKDENRRDEVRMEIEGDEETGRVENERERENTEISEDEDQRASVSAFNGSYGEGSGDGQGSEEAVDDDDCQIVYESASEMPPLKTAPQKRKKRQTTPPPARKMTTRSMKLGSSTSTGQLSEDRGNGGAGGVKKASKKRSR